MDIDRPTGADYANRNAEVARQIAEGAAEADAASREELERQVTVLRGQVAFLAGLVAELADKTQIIYYYGDDMAMLKKIEANDW